jgi:6-phosphogluconolactonase (cycloisomerase 2 family)
MRSRFLSPAAYARFLAIGLLVLGSTAQAAPLDILDARQENIFLDGARAVAPSPDGRFIYVCAQNGSTLVPFAVDPTTGVLTIGTVMTEDEGLTRGLFTCLDVAVSPDGRFVYTAGAFGIGVYARNGETGELEHSLTVTSTVDAVPTAFAFSPDGTSFYVGTATTHSLVAFERNLESGALTAVDEEFETPPPDALFDPLGVGVSPDGTRVFLVTGGGGTNIVDSLITFTRDTATGEIDFLDVDRDSDPDVENLAFPNDLAIAPDGRHLYVSANDSNAVAIFDVSQPDATTFAGSIDAFDPGVGGLFGPSSVAVSPDGAWVVIGADNEGSVALFARDRATGLLTFDRVVRDDGLPTRVLDRIVELAIDPRGRFIYAVSYGDNAVTVLAPEPGGTAIGAVAALAIGALARRRNTRR